MAANRKNPRDRESKIVILLNGNKVGEFGPYQTARGALADAKTLAISRRDNKAANDGIDAVVHTYRDANGQDIGYSVEARKRDEVLPDAFEVLLDSMGTAAARSGATYTRSAQKALSVAFNPAPKPRLGGVAAIYRGRVAGRSLAVDDAGREYMLDPEAVTAARLRVGDTVTVRAVPGEFARFRRSVAKPAHANPQVTFKAKGKRVSFFATHRNPDALAVGSYVDVEKGSTKLGIPAHTTLRIEEITPLGADYGHNVKVVVATARGMGPKRKALFARHMNRLSDDFVNLGDGSGTSKIVVKRHIGYYAKGK